MGQSNNVNTTAQVVKANSQVQPFQLGNFLSNESNQNEQMSQVAKLNDKSINGNVDPVLIEVQKLQQYIMDIQQRVVSIENDGIKGKDLDRQIVEALKDLKNYSSFFEQATFQLESKILKTSISIAQKIIGIEVGENSSKIAHETIKNMMLKLKSASKVTIHLNPKDYVVLKDQLQLGQTVTLQEDSNVTAGGVVIASDLGNFDGNIEAKVKTMLDSLDIVL
ncbi:MAG: flagellar assembly protein FliH [Campylobacterales bacterium]|nr:flagellar assembly protein FliH [Campylobacterales bacterium]